MLHLPSKWGNSRRTPQEEARSSQRRASEKRINIYCCVYRWRDHPHFTKALQKKKRKTGRRHSIRLRNLESQMSECSQFRLSTVISFLLSSVASAHLFSHLSLKPASISLPHPSLFPRLPQPSTMDIMTHLPVKLLPVETARPWHTTRCLSSSLLKSFKAKLILSRHPLGLYHLIMPLSSHEVLSQKPQHNGPLLAKWGT